MMDCRKPSSGFIDNIHADLVEEGLKVNLISPPNTVFIFQVAQPCTQDGYTRVDVKCGCVDCYC